MERNENGGAQIICLVINSFDWRTFLVSNGDTITVNDVIMISLMGDNWLDSDGVSIVVERACYWPNNPCG